jgi:Transcriptional regulatory protein, C terminal
MTRDGQLISLTPKEFDTLVVLVEAAGVVVDREELVSRVWPGRRQSSRKHLVLRKTLGEDVIQTHRGRGYRIALAVVETTHNPVTVTIPKQRKWGFTTGVTAALIALRPGRFWHLFHRPAFDPRAFPELHHDAGYKLGESGICCYFA